MLISPEEWIKNYVFVINECEMHGIGALLYKNMRLNNPEKMIFCTTGADGRVYLGLPISESWKICKDMTYTTNKEIQDTLRRYVGKISDSSKIKISTIKYDYPGGLLSAVFFCLQKCRLIFFAKNNILFQNSSILDTAKETKNQIWRKYNA